MVKLPNRGIASTDYVLPVKISVYITAACVYMLHYHGTTKSNQCSSTLTKISTQVAKYHPVKY